MTTTDSFTRSELEALVRALIEEARQRARRRRRMYGGVLISMAVVGTLVFASFQRSAQSQSTSSAFGPVRTLLGNGKPHVQRGFYPSEGKRGSFTVRIVYIDDRAGNGTRGWRIVPEPTMGTLSPTGQYVQVSGRGRILRMGGHAQAWHARLEGFVTRPGEAKQRIVITMKGRPKGPFVLTPLQPGVLKSDSGTYTRTHATG